MEWSNVTVVTCGGKWVPVLDVENSDCSAVWKRPIKCQAERYRAVEYLYSAVRDLGVAWVCVQLKMLTSHRM